MMLFEPGAASKYLIQQIRHQAAEAEAKARRSLAADKMAVWRNNFASLVEAQIKREISPENFDALRPFIHTSSNLLEQIVREVALNYDRPARREIQVDAPEDPEAEPQEHPAQQHLDLILAQGDRDSLMAEVERLIIFQEAVAVRSVLRGPRTDSGEIMLEHARLEHDILTPDLFDVVVDPADGITAQAIYWVVMERVGSELQEVTHWWDAERFIKWDEAGNLLAEDEHGFGRLPFAFFRRGLPTDSFWYHGAGDDLYEATLEHCILKTFLGRAYRVSSWRQPVVSGDMSRSALEQMLSPNSPVVVPNDGSVSMLAFGPEGGLVPHLEAVRQFVDEVAVKYGISPSAFRMTAVAESGFARKLEAQKVLRQARERRKYLIEGELDLLAADAAVLARYELIPAGAFDGVTIIVDPAEPEFSPSPTEQMQIDDWELDHGLISVVDLMKRRNPDLTDEQAEQKLAEHRRQNRRLRAPKPEQGAQAESPLARLLGR